MWNLSRDDVQVPFDSCTVPSISGCDAQQQHDLQVWAQPHEFGSPLGPAGAFGGRRTTVLDAGNGEGDDIPMHDV
ncbi:hypothetical protein QV65_00445 [Rhodococcus erythropolis]|nr:hypothetical protein QV65_00445 [Rhodococcus erythropolis]